MRKFSDAKLSTTIRTPMMTRTPYCWANRAIFAPVMRGMRFDAMFASVTLPRVSDLLCNWDLVHAS
ncbi:hypothetical protein SAMN04488238_1112 [Roseicitreum antarcticum]|uniref:Uncharacterized protein n=1 Tax=Roseicitreum antarcticum TaxID=564137 RepID=A0A1H3CWG8_9RHOB|nr:hypothetical protein SAMN04488238_1112 [Roseicitreum antarcticum]